MIAWIVALILSLILTGATVYVVFFTKATSLTGDPGNPGKSIRGPTGEDGTGGCTGGDSGISGATGPSIGPTGPPGDSFIATSAPLATLSFPNSIVIYPGRIPFSVSSNPTDVSVGSDGRFVFGTGLGGSYVVVAQIDIDPQNADFLISFGVNVAIEDAERAKTFNLNFPRLTNPSVVYQNTINFAENTTYQLSMTPTFSWEGQYHLLPTTTIAFTKIVNPPPALNYNFTAAALESQQLIHNEVDVLQCDPTTILPVGTTLFSQYVDSDKLYTIKLSDKLPPRRYLLGTRFTFGGNPSFIQFSTIMYRIGFSGSKDIVSREITVRDGLETSPSSYVCKEEFIIPSDDPTLSLTGGDYISISLLNEVDVGLLIGPAEFYLVEI